MYFQCVFKHSLWLHVVFPPTLLRHCRFNIDNVNKRHLLTPLSQSVGSVVSKSDYDVN